MAVAASISNRGFLTFPEWPAVVLRGAAGNAAAGLYRARNPHFAGDAEFRTACPTFSLYGFVDMLSSKHTWHQQRSAAGVITNREALA
jgi:hypothetical protein